MYRTLLNCSTAVFYTECCDMLFIADTMAQCPVNCSDVYSC